MVYGLVVVFKFELGAEFWYLWLPNFVVGGILFLTVFLRSARLPWPRTHTLHPSRRAFALRLARRL